MQIDSLSFCGDGLKGVFQAGALHELRMHKIRAKTICGTSIGAVTALVECMGWSTSLETMLSFIPKKCCPCDQLKQSPCVAYLHGWITNSCFVPNALSKIRLRMLRWIWANLRKDPNAYKRCNGRLQITVTDCETRMPRVVCHFKSNAHLFTCIRATTCIPWATCARPVCLDGRKCIDGGACDTAPAINGCTVIVGCQPYSQQGTISYVTKKSWWPEISACLEDDAAYCVKSHEYYRCLYALGRARAHCYIHACLLPRRHRRLSRDHTEETS